MVGQLKMHLQMILPLYSFHWIPAAAISPWQFQELIATLLPGDEFMTDAHYHIGFIKCTFSVTTPNLTKRCPFFTLVSL